MADRPDVEGAKARADQEMRFRHHSSVFPQGDHECWGCKVPTAWHGKDPRCEVIRLLDALEATESQLVDAEARERKLREAIVEERRWATGTTEHNAARHHLYSLIDWNTDAALDATVVAPADPCVCGPRATVPGYSECPRVEECYDKWLAGRQSPVSAPTQSPEETRDG